MKTEGRSAPYPHAGVSDHLSQNGRNRVSFYGRHEISEQLIFVGTSDCLHAQTPMQPLRIIFQHSVIVTTAPVTIFAIAEHTNIHGFIAVVASNDSGRGSLCGFFFERDDVGPTEFLIDNKTVELSSSDLVVAVAPLLDAADPSTSEKGLRKLLRLAYCGEAYIEIYGYHEASAGWLLNGWVSQDWIAASGSDTEVRLKFLSGMFDGKATAAYYERDDLHGRGLGFLIYVPVAGDVAGKLSSLTLASGEAVVTARPALTLEKLGGDRLSEAFSGLVTRCHSSAATDLLVAIILRDLAEDERGNGLTYNVEVDVAYDCRPDSLVLVGWRLVKPSEVLECRLCSPDGCVTLNFSRMSVPTKRPDVVEGFGDALGLSDINCGFVLRAPLPANMAPPFELELHSAGRVSRRSLPALRHPDLHNIIRILSSFDMVNGNVQHLYDNVVGPAIAACNHQISNKKIETQVLQLGSNLDVLCTIIIPLYGRIDFMQYQLAIFARLGLGLPVKIVYVIDDPPRVPEARTLAMSLFNKYRIPLTVISNTENVGFARANKLGLEHAKGKYVCFMNSDVFPITGEWLPNLIEPLAIDETLGAVGPLLLFEDGSVQHQGITFERIPAYDRWYFPRHGRKGLRPSSKAGLHKTSAITGACLVMRLAQAQVLGGFDERYIVGDFEDTDLCLKLRQLGMSVAVNFDIKLYHLERKSQASSAHPWRKNTTLYNAWVHQRRWEGVIGEISETPSEA